MLEGMIGPIAGILGIAGLGYQLFKMIRTKETRAISYNLSILVGFSILLWALYGVERNDPIIYIPNFILVGILSGMFVYKMKIEELVKV